MRPEEFRSLKKRPNDIYISYHRLKALVYIGYGGNPKKLNELRKLAAKLVMEDRKQFKTNSTPQTDTTWYTGDMIGYPWYGEDRAKYKLIKFSRKPSA